MISQSFSRRCLSFLRPAIDFYVTSHKASVFFVSPRHGLQNRTPLPGSSKPRTRPLRHLPSSSTPSSHVSGGTTWTGQSQGHLLSGLHLSAKEMKLITGLSEFTRSSNSFIFKHQRASLPHTIREARGSSRFRLALVSQQQFSLTNCEAHNGTRLGMCFLTAFSTANMLIEPHAF